MTEGLPWPPRKEDLERMYLQENLSAAKIANAYGLHYKSPKVAESTVLYHLRRNGIPRRDRTEHVRRVTPEMVDDWVGRYQSGESLKRIATGKVTPVTVWNHLRSRGIPLRDKVEAQIQAVKKYERLPFGGDSLERAYLMGLRYGDLHVVRHGRAIRVRVSTTHPAMANLFDDLFSAYAYVHHYPRRARLVGYEWTLECDLDSSFEFLLSKPLVADLGSWNDELFLAFVAGLFDAEGSILLHKKGNHFWPEVSIANSERQLVDLLFYRLRVLGFSVNVRWAVQNEDRRGISGKSTMGRLMIWRIKDVKEFLRQVHFRHRERIAKAKIVNSLELRVANEAQIVDDWKNLKISIQRERAAFLQSAASLISEPNRSNSIH
jgi:LAGLIDADG-like domain